MRQFASMTSETRLNGCFVVAAQGVVLLCLFATTFNVAGYPASARLISLAMLCTAAMLLWVVPGRVASAVAGSAGRGVLLIGTMLVAIGIFQVVPIEHSTVVTSVDQIRSEFGGDAADLRYPLTLSPWSTKTWVAMASIGLIAFALSRALFSTPKSRLWLLAAVAVCGASQVFWAVIQALRFPNDIFWGMPNPGGSRPLGTFLNCNHGADFLGMALGCTIGLIWYALHSGSDDHRRYGPPKGFHSLISNPGAIGFCCLALWLLVGIAISLSRGGWISIVAALLAVPLCWSHAARNSRRLLIPAALAAACFVCVSVQVLGLGDRISHNLDDLRMEKIATDGRWDHWAEALPAVQYFQPWGSGLGTYGYAYLPFDPEPMNGWYTHAHNQYLETLMEAGLPVLGLALLAILLLYRACLNLCDERSSVTQQAIGIAALIALTMQVLHAFTDFGLMMPANLLVLALISGAAISSSGKTDESSPVVGWKRHIGTLAASVLLSLLLAAATWHQLGCVRVEQLLSVTRFSSATPAPTVEVATDWIQKLEPELQRSPDNEELLMRLTQLHVHRAQRFSFDQILRDRSREGQPPDIWAVWSRTTMDAVIARLYDDSDSKLTSEQKQAIRTTMQKEPDLATARTVATILLQLNPLIARGQLRLAQLQAVSGLDWKPHFNRAMQLSVVNPMQSLGAGLLAWAADDQQAMIDQWRQTLLTDPSQMNVILPLIRSRLADEDIVERLMPNRWTVPYRLAITLRKSPEDTELRERLLEKAKQIAKETEADEPGKWNARAIIATERGDHDHASEMYALAVKSAPRDPELRYRHANSLLRSGQGREAAMAAQVALQLSPGTEKYSTLLNRARELYRRQAKSPE